MVKIAKAKLIDGIQAHARTQAPKTAQRGEKMGKQESEKDGKHNLLSMVSLKNLSMPSTS